MAKECVCGKCWEEFAETCSNICDHHMGDLLCDHEKNTKVYCSRFNCPEDFAKCSESNLSWKCKTKSKSSIGCGTSIYRDEFSGLYTLSSIITEIHENSGKLAIVSINAQKRG